MRSINLRVYAALLNLQPTRFESLPSSLDLITANMSASVRAATEAKN